MTKLTTFSSAVVSDLTVRVNNWIEEQEVEVISVSVYSHDGRHFCVICYKEKEAKV